MFLNRGTTALTAGRCTCRDRRRRLLASGEGSGRDRCSGRDVHPAIGVACRDRCSAHSQLTAHLPDAVRRDRPRRERKRRQVLHGRRRDLRRGGGGGDSRRGNRGFRRDFAPSVFVGQPRIAGGRLWAFFRTSSGFGARSSGHLAGGLFDGLFFDRRRGFFGRGRRLLRGWGSFFSCGGRLFGGGRGHRSGFFGCVRRFFSCGGRLFGGGRDHGSGFFGCVRRFFSCGGRLFGGRRTAFDCRFACRRFRGAFGCARRARLSGGSEEERRGYERHNQPQRNATSLEGPCRRTLDRFDHDRCLKITSFRPARRSFRLTTVIPALSSYE